MTFEHSHGSSTSKLIQKEKKNLQAWGSCQVWFVTQKTDLVNLPSCTNQLHVDKGPENGHWLVIYISDDILHVLEVEMYFFLQHIIKITMDVPC